jgi:hypothetical protein
VSAFVRVWEKCLRWSWGSRRLASLATACRRHEHPFADAAGMNAAPPFDTAVSYGREAGSFLGEALKSIDACVVTKAGQRFPFPVDRRAKRFLARSSRERDNSPRQRGAASRKILARDLSARRSAVGRRLVPMSVRRHLHVLYRGRIGRIAPVASEPSLSIRLRANELWNLLQ